MAFRYSRRDVLRMAGGLAVAIGPTSLLVSAPGCGGDDDGGGGDGADGGDGIDAGGLDANGLSVYGTPGAEYGCYQIESYFEGYGFNSYDDLAYYYYFYQFACLDPPTAPWDCYYDELPDHHYLCYTSQYYYITPYL